MNNLILASASAVRARLLENAGVAVIRAPADIDEAAIKAEYRRRGDLIEECAMALATAKAQQVAPRYADAMILGADQILGCGDRWFDKPRDRDEARAQLRQLSGASHELVTAAVIWHRGAVSWRCIERPRLAMRRLSETFLEDYVTKMGERVTASVGAYELEGLGAQLMDRVDGDYFSILGLPLLPLLAYLRDAGMLLP